MARFKYFWKPSDGAVVLIQMRQAGPQWLFALMRPCILRNQEQIYKINIAIKLCMYMYDLSHVIALL